MSDEEQTFDEEIEEPLEEVAGEPEEEQDCLACEALEYFCETIDDEDAKAQCKISTKAVQDGILSADKAREEIMGLIGEDRYQSSVDKTNVFLSHKFEQARDSIRQARKGTGVPDTTDANRHLLPEEDVVPEEAIN